MVIDIPACVANTIPSETVCDHGAHAAASNN